MNKLAIIATFALSPAVIFAQEALPPAPTANVTKLIHLRYARAEAVKDIVTLGGVHGAANNGLKVLLLYGTPAQVSSAEEAIKEIDVPSPDDSARDVEIKVYVIGASSKSSEVASSPEIEPVLRQLKAVFPYTSYQLLDSTMIRAREGHNASARGLLKNFPNAQAGFLNTYLIGCALEPRSSGGNDRTIRFNKFSFNTGVPDSDVRVSVETDLDVQSDEKVVVGNTNIDGGNSALFIVVSAKFVQ
ncbi:MAG: hypothetical protein JO340_06305 [Acidobacteriaceae bacterium]|nr:hypothetical protein [Acidobacteriaceae bacterium]